MNRPTNRHLLFALALMVLTQLAITGCGSSEATSDPEIQELLDTLETAYCNLESFKASVGIPGYPAQEQYYMLNAGVIQVRKRVQPGAVILEDYENSIQFKVAAPTPTIATTDPLFGQCISMCPVEGALRKNHTVTIVTYEDLDGTNCVVIEAQAGKAMSKFWIGMKDGILRRLSNVDRLVDFSITDINTVANSVFEIPDSVSIRPMSEKKKAMMKKIRAEINKQ